MNYIRSVRTALPDKWGQAVNVAKHRLRIRASYLQSLAAMEVLWTDFVVALRTAGLDGAVCHDMWRCLPTGANWKPHEGHVHRIVCKQRLCPWCGIRRARRVFTSIKDEKLVTSSMMAMPTKLPTKETIDGFRKLRRTLMPLGESGVEVFGVHRDVEGDTYGWRLRYLVAHDGETVKDSAQQVRLGGKKLMVQRTDAPLSTTAIAMHALPGPLIYGMESEDVLAYLQLMHRGRCLRGWGRLKEPLNTWKSK
jgi:hypothetical protein